MSNNKKFNEFIKTEQSNCEKYLRDNNAYTQVPKNVESKHVQCYDNLAIIYRSQNDTEKSNKMFYYLTTIHQYPTRYAGLSEEGKKDQELLASIGRWQLKKGFYFNLAKTDPQKAIQLFEWAAENCRLSDEYVADEIQAENYNDIAVGHLWRGYALLNLGRYKEAYDLLKEVNPYFNKWKKSGGEVWKKIEYALTKALVPLCEYKLEPTQENLLKAKAGIEDYITSLRENKDKLEGYLDYFHLKEAFADVYGAEKASEAAPSKVKKPVKKLSLPPTEYDTKGSVIIFDREGSGSLEVFGSNNEFEAYVEKVKSLGDFPVLSSLMELYATEGLQESVPLIEECERLLSRSDIEPYMKEKTKLILIVARDAKEVGSTMMLYFDPEV